jgi:hypothetical protein
LFIADLFHNDTLSFLGGKTQYQDTSLETEPETDFHIFVWGWIKIGGVLLLALAGAWWQRPERPRKNFNKICFLGLHGEI